MCNICKTSRHRSLLVHVELLMGVAHNESFWYLNISAIRMRLGTQGVRIIEAQLYFTMAISCIHRYNIESRSRLPQGRSRGAPKNAQEVYLIILLRTPFSS